MKKTFTLGTLVLGCCLVAVAQTGSTPNQTPPSSTPSIFPQDQTGQVPSNPAVPADPTAIPPDTKASGRVANSQASNSQETTVQGCLSQSSVGNFMLVDNSGNNIQLRGEASQLNSYLGKEVRVDGIAMPSAPSAGAMSSGSSSGATTQFSVSNVHKVSDVCAAKVK
jgi:hypothetical protein